jgi:hypothetical protein
MRNSVSPISFAKDERFKTVKTGGMQAPFYDVKDTFKQKQSPYKKGWGFGYS